ncbi:MAG: 50S ribosomal protein L32e [Candidatus Thermoplasmatota archaeon]|jgi:large subunit ribosomal protein L32e|nr:50S ribosomal protein L32e [Candidatus Thermoplasmatota archaeon]MCL5794201.1 50S ribosomal protein L32e [Candidatus Thermoplasmatota archaeon]
MSQLKPTLTDEEKRLLKKKNELARKRVEFHRQEWHRYKKLGDSWRKPRGKHSKLREQIDTRIPIVDAGFRGPRSVRGLHPSGFREVLVHTPGDLDKIDASRSAARIGSTVGSRKREIIEKRAQELNIRVLNPGVK